MIYRLTQADEVVARLDNDYNIVYGDHVNRIPQWIYQCLSDLNIKLGLIPAAHVAEVKDYFGITPDDLKELIGVEHNGARLDRRSLSQFKYQTNATSGSIAYIKTNVGVTVTGTLTNVTLDDSLSDIEIQVDKIRVRDASSIAELPLSAENYMLLPNGKIETSFETGVVIFHYYKFPSSYNERLNSECPWIPDDEAVKDCAAIYILKNLLQRGYKHPVYSLASGNPEINPAYLYRTARKKARIVASRPDHDQGKLIDDMWNSHLYNVISKYR